jgi:hypothetical protein
MATTTQAQRGIRYKSICKSCIGKYSEKSWSSKDEYLWTEGKVRCPRDFVVASILSSDKTTPGKTLQAYIKSVHVEDSGTEEVPISCPYYLENILGGDV